MNAGTSDVTLSTTAATTALLSPSHATQRRKRQGDANRIGKLYNLINLIEDQVSSAQERRSLRQLLLDSQPRQSKWFNPNRTGQAELYDELERVLIQLKSFTPHSGPFLQRVNRKEVPDYYEIVKKPMDLGTMMKKLRSFAYTDRQSFQVDLELIHSNCYLYNSDPESSFRRHADLLRERWIVLMRNVPDIVIESKDDIDSLLNAHLDKFSDDDSTISAASTFQAPTISSQTIPSQSSLSTAAARSTVSSTLNAATDGLDIPFPARSSLGMAQYYEVGALKSIDADALFFHQTFPDSISFSVNLSPPASGDEGPPSESLRSTCEKFQVLRELLHAPPISPSPTNEPTQQQIAEGKSAIIAGALTPRLSHMHLSTSVAWLCLQSGFESANRHALSCLSDVLTAFIGQLCTSIKLYIEERDRPYPISPSWLASKILQDYYVRGPRKLLKLLRDEPAQLQRRLDKAINLVQERRVAMAESFSTATAATADHMDADTNTIVETDVDLDLLGDESGGGGGGNWSHSSAAVGSRNNITADLDRDTVANYHHDDDDDDERSEDDRALQEFLEEPLDFSDRHPQDPNCM